MGLTTGYGYCSDIGSSLRKDYVVVSNDVNMAARLMCKAKGRILVDEATMSSLPIEAQAQLSQAEEMLLKGAALPVRPYMYTGDSILSMNILKQEKQSTGILRSHVKHVLETKLDNMLSLSSQYDLPNSLLKMNGFRLRKSSSGLSDGSQYFFSPTLTKSTTYSDELSDMLDQASNSSINDVEIRNALTAQDLATDKEAIEIEDHNSSCFVIFGSTGL